MRHFISPDSSKKNQELLKEIRESKKTVVVYSDYDADGIPGAVVLHDLFKKIGYTNFINYIPHRHDEGFGLNIEAIESFIKEGVNLIITLDCGISDIEPIKLAQENGIDVIVTDHHEPHEELPPAYAF